MERILRIQSVEEFLDANGFQVNSECGTAKTSDAKGTKFATVTQIGMIGMPEVRVGVIGCAMRLVGNHTNFHAIQE